MSAGGVRGSLGRLWPFVRPHRRALLAVAGLAPVVELAGLVQPSLLKRAVDQALAAGDAAGLDRLALAFLAALGVELAAAAGVQYATAAVAQRTVRDLRQALFGRLVRRPMAVVDREPVGTTIARLTTDVEALQELFAAGAVTIVLDGLRVVGTAGAMLWLDARLALVSLALVPAALAAIAAFRRAAPAAYRAVRDRTAALGGVVQETLAGMRVVALSRREAATVAEHAAASGAQRDATLAAGRLEVRLFATMEALATLSVALVLVAGGWLGARGVLAVGTVVAFVQYVQQLFAPLRDASARWGAVQAAMAAGERVIALLDAPVEAAPARPRVAARARGEIAFDGVSFAYPGGDRVLRDVSFRLAPGTHVALVGASGSGKSTIVKLLQRFYDVDRGRILVDGLDVRAWDPAALRRRVGVVAQDVVLFRGSVLRNLTLGRADVRRADVVRAVARTGAEDVVARLGGYEARLGERGANLSVGERQLLALARALAHDPTILVLDEASAHLDRATEARLRATLDGLRGTRTVLTIAHRLASVERADRILVLDGGAVVQDGRHDELIARPGPYARLRRLQDAPLRGAAAR